MKPSLTGCTLIANRLFDDERGFFTEIYKRSTFHFFPKIKQWNMSQSKCNVVRGLHFQTQSPQGKLVRVLDGSILDVVVDLRMGSPTYGHMEQFCLHPRNFSLYVPVGFAHSFYVLSLDGATVLYGCTEEYDPASDGGINPLDPDMDYPWKNSHPVISEKDKKLPNLKEFKSPFHY